MSEIEIALDCNNMHGEGPVWDVNEGRLYWTDIEGRRLWWLDPESGKSASLTMREKVCAVAFREAGGLLLAFESGLSFFDPKSEREERIVDLESDRPSTRMNDGRCDRNGRFIIGGFDNDMKDQSAVYRLDPDLHAHKLFEGVSSANSTCFSLDGSTMYFANTPEQKIVAFDYDAGSGALGPSRTFCTFEDQPGLPDGSAIDEEGCLWNAQWNGSRVVRYTPDGGVDRVYEMPCMNPTCVAFGGKSLDTLFVTSSRFTLSAEQQTQYPGCGALYAITPGVKGVPESRFSG